MKRPVKILLIILFFIVDAFCITLIFKTHNRVHVDLIGESNINYTYGQDYNDAGFKVILNEDEININDVEYDIISDVDSTKLGDYTIKYHIKYFNKEYDLERKVSIVDDEAPIIETNLEEVTLGYCDNELKSNLEYNATDNFDGNLTDKIEKNETDDKYILSVTDSNGNTTKKELKKKIGDKPNNKIVLNGRASISIAVGGVYDEQGAYLTDGCGNTIEGEVETSGKVDTSKVGKYTITYKAKDDSNINNTRTVTVYKETATNNSGGSKIIYLTFDDGPSGYTSQILNTLAKYNIKATFFVTLAGNDDVIRREYNEGHTVALHTATHDYKKIYSSVNAYFDDLNRVSDRVKRITGQETKFIRFPGGTSNQVSAVGMSNIVNEVNKRGYTYFDWNVSVEDAGSCAYVSDKQGCVVNNFKKWLNPNKANIVLMHDIKSYTAAGLETMIKYALNQGYTFKPIDSNTTPVHFKPYK